MEVDEKVMSQLALFEQKSVGVLQVAGNGCQAVAGTRRFSAVRHRTDPDRLAELQTQVRLLVESTPAPQA